MNYHSSSTKPSLARNLWRQWTLVNTLGYGLGCGGPILLADLLSVLDYRPYLTFSILFFLLGVGVAQWLVLRRVIPIPLRWIWIVFFSFVISTSLTTPISNLFPVGDLPPFITVVLTFFSLHLLINCIGQWIILRGIVQRSRGWLLANSIGTVLGVAVGFLTGIVTYIAVHRPGISAFIGTLSWGLTYSAISSIGVRYLTKQEYTYNLQTQPSSIDAPPNSKVWRIQLFSTLSFLTICGLWIYVLPLDLIPQEVLTSPLPWLKSIYPLLLMLGFFGYTYLSISIHELGHFLFGWFNGFDLKYFAVSRWILIRRHDRLQFRRTNSTFAGGFVLSVPKSVTYLNKRLFLVMMGGPAASFFLFFVGIIPLLFPALVRENLILQAIAFYSIFNCYVGLFNILPLQSGYLRTDGRRMLDLCKKNLHGRFFRAIYSFYASLRQGIRPQDLDPVIVEDLLAVTETSSDRVSGLLVAYYVKLDKGQFEQAGDYLDRALEISSYYPQVFRGALFLEGAYFEAYIRHRVDLARQWFDKIQERTLIEPYTLLRAEAALLLAQGDKSGALTKAQEGLAFTQRDRFTIGMAVAENDWLQALIAKIAPSDLS